jgi:WD40 repeat protein
VFFLAGSHVLVSIGQNRYTGDIIQWDPDSGRLLKTLEVKAPYGVRSVSPDLRWAAVNVPKPISPPGHFDNARASIQLIDTADGSEGRIWPGYSVRFTYDSKRVLIRAWNDPQAVVWDVESGMKLGVWPHAGWVEFSPDGHLAVTQGSEGMIILDVETGKPSSSCPRNAEVAEALLSVRTNIGWR